MRRYETIYILRPNIGEDAITTIVDRTNGVIEDRNGQIIQLDRWGLKKLAYLIKKETQGYYVYSEYAGTPEAVDEIERLFRIDDNVLKYLTVKLNDVYVPHEAEVTQSSPDEAEEAQTVSEAAEEPASEDADKDTDE